MEEVMTRVTIEVDLPPELSVTAYQRHGNGHGFEISWPLPTRCRCDSCRREDQADVEFKDTVQVVRDLDIWGQPSFWIYRPAYHRCPYCNHRQYLIPPFKRKDTSYTYRFEQQVLRLLIGSNEEEVARRLGISAEMVGLIVRHQLADAHAKEIDPQRVLSDVGLDELSLKKRHQLYATILTDLTNPERPEVLAVAEGRGRRPKMPGKAGGSAAAASAGVPGRHGGGVPQRLPGTVTERQARGRSLPRGQEVQRGQRWPAKKKSAGRTRRSCRRPSGRSFGR